MSFKVEQKIGKYIYIYETESYWDKNKQQARQRRKYIGKKDLKSGKIITPRLSNKPKVSRDYGIVYLLEKISHRLGLTKILNKYFEDDSKAILALVYFMITDIQALYLYKDWVESTFIDQNVYMTAKQVSEFLNKINNSEVNRQRFLSEWTKLAKSNEAVIFDITSLSSYGLLNETVEWGYNRDRETLAQINLGVVYSEGKKLPLFYKIYQGSINDVVTLEKLSKEVKVNGIKDAFFVLDRGFYSEHNIKEIKNLKLRFILSASGTNKRIKNLINKHSVNIANSENAFLSDKHVIHHIQDKVTIGGCDLIAHIYYSEERRSSEYNNFLKQILEAEKVINKKEFKEIEEAEDYIESLNYKTYFNTSIENNIVLIRRKSEAINERIGKMGIMVLLTNTDKSKEETLDLYKRRDGVEKLFDVLKNELNSSRLRVHTRETMEGVLFIKFISLILYSELFNIMKEAKLNEKYTVRELVQELKKIRKVEMINGENYTTEISNKQKNILQAFNVPIPI